MEPIVQKDKDIADIRFRNLELRLSATATAANAEHLDRLACLLRGSTFLWCAYFRHGLSERLSLDNALLQAIIEAWRFGIRFVHVSRINICLFHSHQQSFFDYPFLGLIGLVLSITFLISHLNYVLLKTPSRKAMITLFDKLTGRRRASGSQPYHFAGITSAKTGRQKLIIAVESLILLSLISVAAWKIHSDAFAFKFVANATARTFEEQHKAVVKDVDFGNRFKLRALSEKWLENGLQLTFVWQSLTDQPLDWAIALHLLDAHGHVLSAHDFLQDEDKSKVKAGQIWGDRIVIDRKKLAGASTMGIGMYPSPKAILLPVRFGIAGGSGSRVDCHQSRLVIPIEDNKDSH
jgi:hypothetical protein